MAVDKLVDSAQLNTDLTSIANAIRTKGGTSASLSFPTDFITAIQNIPSGGNDFVITVSKNSQTGNWEPDCTWADLAAAYEDGKTITLNSDDMITAIADGDVHLLHDQLTAFDYLVQELFDDGQDEDFWIVSQSYHFDSSGLTMVDEYTYYDTSPADATSADVRSGKVAYGPNGRIIGAATLGNTIVFNGGLVSQSDDGQGNVELEFTGSVGLPDYGLEEAATLGGLLHALSTGNYHTGTFTVSSYFPANTESEILDTGYTDNVFLICIYDAAKTPSTSSTEKLLDAMGFFSRPESNGADQAERTTWGFIRRAGGSDTKMFGSRMTSYRVNSGKLYATPKYAQTNFTYFVKNSTYRWFAVPWPEVTS